ncbi:MAG: helix-turn-helix transcriptional regulator [Salinivirgaceae bacterium]|nr:helix-turn-helix transcriptional regulator [Salinivirgaceae bacterium]
MEFQQEIQLISSKIKSYRIERNMSVQDLAYLCNMERSSISRIESGRVNITVKTLCIISSALGIEPKDLL